MTKAEIQLGALIEGLPSVVVVDKDWGDSGKGKIVDFMSSRFPIVSRFGGGANAGHTVVLPFGAYIGHLIPMGITHGKICVLPQEELFDPYQFFKEIEEFKQKSKRQPPPIYVSGNAPLKLPWDPLIEAWIECSRGVGATGTTGKGIGSIAANQKLRIGPRVNYIFYPEMLKKELEVFYRAWRPIFEEIVKAQLVQKDGVPIKEQDIPSVNSVLGELIGLAERLKPFVIDTRAFLYKAWKKGKKILFEGAQGLMLDEFGTYHYNTTGICTASGAARGTGLPLQAIGPVIVVAKAYTTRVGNGPFPTELWNRRDAEKAPEIFRRLFVEGEEREKYLKDTLAKINAGDAPDSEIGLYLQVKGHELGATTGRGRSTGWPDLVIAKYCVEINNPWFWAFTRMDILSGLKKIKVAKEYLYEGNKVPAGTMLSPSWLLKDVRVIYDELDGWEEDISGITDLKRLPVKTREYLEYWEEKTGRPVGFISTGPRRHQIIIKEPLKLKKFLKQVS